MIDFSKIFDHPVYEVGGCVRDSILGVQVKDIDIASSLTPLEFKALCKEKKFKTFDTGIEHGTITVLIDKTPYEHTTFRKDVSCDGRNATVEYSNTIEEDLSRRDFTINAIARLSDQLIDPFGGINDLNSRKLRTVGKPEERFSEDYLRIIRAARFKSRFNMEVDVSLINAAKQLAPNIIKYVSIERVTDEIRKAQKNGADFIRAAEELGFLSFIFPECKAGDLKKELWVEHIKRSQNLSELHYFAAIFIELFHEKSFQKASEFKLSNHFAKGIRHFFESGTVLEDEISPAELRALIIKTSIYYKDLKVYTGKVLNEDTTPGLKAADEIEPAVILSIKEPFIDGTFLKKAGTAPGPHFKKILEECGNAQAEGQSRKDVEQLALKLINP